MDLLLHLNFEFCHFEDHFLIYFSPDLGRYYTEENRLWYFRDDCEAHENMPDNEELIVVYKDENPYTDMIRMVGSDGKPFNLFFIIEEPILE